MDPCRHVPGGAGRRCRADHRLPRRRGPSGPPPCSCSRHCCCSATRRCTTHRLAAEGEGAAQAHRPRQHPAAHRRYLHTAGGAGAASGEGRAAAQPGVGRHAGRHPLPGVLDPRPALALCRPLPAARLGSRDVPRRSHERELRDDGAGDRRRAPVHGGAVVYALKKPNPWPGHFGFHEIFHVCTVLAFLCHWTACLLIALSPLSPSLGAP